MNAVCTTAPSNQSVFYKAVCYRCRYVGMDVGVSRCPLCEFPIILEPGQVPEADEQPDLAEIFERTSVATQALPLPGVDDTPRKAQLLAEARRRRREAERTAKAEREAAARRARLMATRRMITEGSGTTAVQPRSTKLKVSLILAAAGAIGLLAACVNAGITP